MNPILGNKNELPYREEKQMRKKKGEKEPKKDRKSKREQSEERKNGLKDKANPSFLINNVGVLN